MIKIEFRTFKSSKVSFKYLVTWEVEKANISNNPDCIATISKGEENLLNVVEFPTRADIEEFKPLMEDLITDDGGVIISSDFVLKANKEAIELHAVMYTPQINFDIYTYVFIEENNIYIFELRTVDGSDEVLKEYDDLINSFEII